MKMTFAEKCRQVGIKESTGYSYRKKHPELTEEEVLKRSRGSYTFKAKCERYGINPGTARSYRNKHPQLTDEQVIAYYINHKSLAKRCQEAGLNYDMVRQFRLHHKELTDDEVFDLYLNSSEKKYNVKTNSFKVQCEKARVSYDKARKYRKEHSELTNEQVISKILSEVKEPTLKERCKLAGVCYGSVLMLKKQGLTADEAIRYLQEDPKHPYKQLVKWSRQLGLNEDVVRRFKRTHPKLTDMEVIIYYKPEVKFNLFGELLCEKRDQ